MRHTSIYLFLVPVWFDLGFLVLSTSLSGCILIPLMRLHTVYLTLCFLPAHLEQNPWRELERALNPKANPAPFHGKGKTKGKRSISKPFYVFDLSQRCSFNLSCTSDMKKPWKLIHFRDESVLATVPRNRTANSGWTGIPGLSEGIIPWKTAPGKCSLPCCSSALVVGSWHRVQFHLGSGQGRTARQWQFSDEKLGKKKKKKLKNYTYNPSEERSSLCQALIHSQNESFLFTRSCWHYNAPK